MSEMEKREERSGVDTMSTEELQEILRKHVHGELDTEPDTDELYKIMEVLAERRRQQPSEQRFRSDEEAFADFKANYMPKEDKKETRTRGASARFMKAAAAMVAVVLILAAGVTVTAEAFKIDVRSKIATWTREIFYFVDGANQTLGTTPQKENHVKFESLQDALVQEGITEKLAPTWLPEGYVHKDLKIVDTPKTETFHAVYEKDGEELLIVIRQTFGVQASYIEKNDHFMEIYVVDGVEYYIFSNAETLQAAWMIGEFECGICGKITLEEMKAMIDSITN